MGAVRRHRVCMPRPLRSGAHRRVISTPGAVATVVASRAWTRWNDSIAAIARSRAFLKSSEREATAPSISSSVMRRKPPPNVRA